MNNELGIDYGKKKIVIQFIIYVLLTIFITFIILSLNVDYWPSRNGIALALFRMGFILILIIVNIYFILAFYSSFIEYNLTHGCLYRIYNHMTLKEVDEEINKNLKRLQIQVDGMLKQQSIYPDIIPGLYKRIEFVIFTVDPRLRIVFTLSRDTEGRSYPSIFICPCTDINEQIPISIFNLDL